MPELNDSQIPKQNSPGQPLSLWVFFWSCLKISAFTLGGGYVIVPLQKRRFCNELGWLTEDRVLELIAIAQTSPGPVAVNASTLMGYQLFGLKGGLVAALATVLPPLVILTLVSLFYEALAQNDLARAVLRGMQAAVAALIVYTVWGMAKSVLKTKSPFLWGLLALCLALVFFTKINIVLVLLLAAGISLAAYGLDHLVERGH